MGYSPWGCKERLTHTHMNTLKFIDKYNKCTGHDLIQHSALLGLSLPVSDNQNIHI